MAEQEFLASFGVEIDESGVDRLQKALESNRTLAEELAAAFGSAREAVTGFFSQLSASTLPSGELSPWQRLTDLSEEGFSFELDLETAKAEEKLDAFLENVQHSGLLDLPYFSMFFHQPTISRIIFQSKHRVYPSRGNSHPRFQGRSKTSTFIFGRWSKYLNARGESSTAQSNLIR